MGFRCSILGCEYAEQRHEREREQRGEEVVLTVREYEECRHCGDKRLISENTGVTTAPEAHTTSGDEPDEPSDPAGFYDEFDDQEAESAPSEDETALLDDAEAAGELDVDPDGAVPDDPADDDLPEDEGVEFIDADSDSGADADTGADPASSTANDPEALVPEADDPEFETASEPPDVDGEDAVLLADDADEDGAQADARTTTGADVAGATEAPATGADSTDPTPTQAPTSTSTADAAGTDNAFVGTDDGNETETDFGDWPDTAPEDTPEYDHGDWPAHPADDDTGEAFAGVASVTETGGADAGAGTATASVEVESDAGAGVEEGHDAAVEHGPGARTTRTDVAGELHCRSCGYSDAPSGTPHRSGDICPDCGSGYLAER